MGFFDKGKIVKEVIDSTSGLTDSVSNGVTSIVAASKGEMTPEAKFKLAELTLNIGFMVKELGYKIANSFQDFMLAYEGASKDMPKSIQILRAIIRPFITIYTYVIFGVFCTIDVINLLKRVENYEMILKQLPTEFWVVFSIILTFWFGGKVGERIVEKIKQ